MAYCVSCGSKLRESVSFCERCGQAVGHPNTKPAGLWRGKLTLPQVLALLLATPFVILVFIALSGDRATPVRTAPEGAALSAAESASLTVRNMIVKQIGGKHRYFFDIRNAGDRAFAGTVEITLFGKGGGLGRETFEARRPIMPGLGTSAYVDINTGPPAVHGEFGTTRFEWLAKEGGRQVASGTGEISTRLE